MTQEELLQGGHRLAVHWQDRWLFITVLNTETVQMKPYQLSDSDGNQEPLDPGEIGIDDDEIVDANGRNILEPKKTERDIINQVHFGIAPSRMNVHILHGRNYNRSLRDYEEPEDPAPILDGYTTPYSRPSPQHSEMFIFNDMEMPRLQAYNPMDEASPAKVSFHVRKLHYNVITNPKEQRGILQGQVPANIHSAGLGARDNDRIQAPGWLVDSFGQHMPTTNEILANFNEEDLEEQTPQVPGLDGSPLE